MPAEFGRVGEDDPQKHPKGAQKDTKCLPGVLEAEVGGGAIPGVVGKGGGLAAVGDCGGPT